MGINYRYALALLALIPALSLGAVRTKVSTSSADVIKAPSSTSLSPDFQTPNGAIHYYGPDKYYSLDSSLNAQGGSSIGPTVRPVSGSTVLPGGSTSFPYGPGAYTGGNTNPTIKVKPKVVVPKARPYAKLKNVLKVSPAQIAGSAIVGAALAGVGWVMSEDNTKVMKKDYSYDTSLSLFWCGQPNSVYCYSSSPTSNRYPSPSDAKSPLDTYFCDQYKADGCTPSRFKSTMTVNASQAFYSWEFPRTPDNRIIRGSMTLYRHGSCKSGFIYIPSTGQCQSETSTGLTPITDSDLSSLDPWLNQQSADWLSGLIREQCNASSSPNACYDEMRDFSQDSLSGPASAAGPSTTRTTTTTNPDASTSTTTQNTTTNYTFNYGSNYFDTNTTTTTTTSKDGLPVSTETQQDTTTPTDTPEPEPEPDYSFSDSPMPDVPSFYTQKYPDGLSGVWNDAKSDFDQSDFMTFLHSFVPSFSGTCPTWSMSFSIGRMVSLGSHEFANLCYVFDFIKVCMLLGAVFLSRSLIFGG